jgi:acetylornithine deacetylase/succinyl-diaminopimelate desuccinylase-like protein
MAVDVQAFHRRAVETPSHEDVEAMRTLLVETLEDHDAEPTVDEAGNVIATRGQPAVAPHLVLQTHLDTVPPHVDYGRDGDRVRGRGACDAKGPLAAMVAAFVAAEVGEGRVTLAVTPDEETTQLGAEHLAARLSADAYIVGEPTGLDVCTGARGQFEGTVTIRGEAGHAADPDSGANAIAAVEAVLRGLRTYDETAGPGTHDLLGDPLLTPSMIEGGEAPNRIPGTCTITFDRRSVPPEDVRAFPEALRSHLGSVVPEGIDVEVALIDPETPFPEAFSTDRDTPVVEALQAARAGPTRPFGAATEASQFAADAPTVLFGPGDLADEEGPIAHAEREYVALSEVERAAAILRSALENFATSSE